MKQQLRKIYWRGIGITLLMAFIAICLASKVKIDDTREQLMALLEASSRWTLDSNEDLQSLADSIAGAAPAVRVTFLLDSGIVLADSQQSPDLNASPQNDPEILEARNGRVGRHLRMSPANTALVMYVAQRIAPQLILRLSYPVLAIARLLLTYSFFLLLLFLILNYLHRSSIARFVSSQSRQLEDIQALLDGQVSSIDAVFPEYQPLVQSISYRIRRLREDQQEIRRTLSLRETFIANASHELRSPLTSVRGYSEMLGEGLAETPEEQELCIQTIRSECDRMLNVIQDILLLSKAGREKAIPDRPAGILPIVREVQQALKPQALEKGIQLLTEAAGDPEVFIPDQDIWEILFNLCDNAIRYGRENGYVRFVIAPDQIRIEDNGIGIAAEVLPHIFEPFYRGDPSHSSEIPGTGLGLAIVHAIVDSFGGSIYAESPPAGGSTFTVNIPEEWLLKEHAGHSAEIKAADAEDISR